MGLDVNSKHGIIIGFFTAVFTVTNMSYSIPFILDDINGVENYYHLDYVIMVIGLMGGISGCLLIFGIVKTHQGLLVPWLVSELWFSTYFAYYSHFDGYQVILILLGLQALLFYPICNLFFEIGRRNAALNAHSPH